MKLSTTVTISALLSFVIGQPVIEQRDSNPFTVTDWVIVTVDVYTTVSGNPPVASPASGNKHANHAAYHAQHNAEVQAQPTSSSQPPPSGQPAAQNTPAPVQQKNIVEAPVASSQPPGGSSPEQIQAAKDAKQAAVNEQQTKVNDAQKEADFAHQSQMDAIQNAGSQPSISAPTSPPASSPAQAPAQSQAPSIPSGGGGGGSCGTIGGQCSGDVTIYNDQGNGACGWANDTNSEDFFALAAPMFGAYSNDGPGGHKNAFCGRMATIKVNGKPFTGMLTDKCGGCSGQSIDLSQHLFSQLYPNEPPGNGRYHDVPWQFTSGPVYAAS